MFSIIKEKRLIQNKVAYEQTTMFATYATIVLLFTVVRSRSRQLHRHSRSNTVPTYMHLLKQ